MFVALASDGDLDLRKVFVKSYEILHLCSFEYTAPCK
jgi:hypothetical protein